jgi:hypothetical protein
MTESLVKLVFMLFVMHNDGTIKPSVHIVEECPPQEYVYLAMEEKLKEKEIKAWAASCQGVKFDFEAGIPS